MSKPRPHVLGIDDAPFKKEQREPVPIVAVMMEGADLVESVALGRFPVDGSGVTEFLAGWLNDLRSLNSAQAVLLGGITIAGLAVVDVADFSRRLGKPVLVATRRNPYAPTSSAWQWWTPASASPGATRSARRRVGSRPRTSAA